MNTVMKASLMLMAPLLLSLAGCADAPPVHQEQENVALLRVPAQKALTLADLKGKPPALIRRRLGPPTLIRREPPAEIWQYGGPSCIFDVVFYPSPAGGLAADWLDSRTLDGSTTDGGACLGDITRSQAAPDTPTLF